MQRFDFGHLEILEVLLEEQSISKAALRLNISPSALSRTLTKMREAVGDQILAPSGRVLRLTKRGLELRDQIKSLNDQARALLEPRKSFNPSNVIRNFKIRASDSSTLLIGSPLLQEVRKITPGVTLSFVTEGKADIESLRKGAIDFDIGSIAEPHPELVSQSLYSDEFVCIASQKEKLSGKQISMLVRAQLGLEIWLFPVNGGTLGVRT